MSAPIRLYDLGPSPNSKKVRLALGYKGIPYERVAVDPADRAAVVRLSGQPLTPVLAHGETVIFDSGAILRYLEANVKREPRLFSEDYDRMKAIEGWEAWARTDLAPGIGRLFGQYFATEKDSAAAASAVAMVNAAARHLESKLDGPFLCGDSLTAADVTCASWLSLGWLTPAQAAGSPILEFFRATLALDPERTTLRRWFDSVDRYDR
jgi:glutathione S-transferase